MSVPNLAKADTTPAWCPACGNYPILSCLQAALGRAGLDRRRVVLVSGIGQAAKLPHYVAGGVNVFNGLHGRAIPAATGIKLANHKLQVVITSGDGDMYGEGGNHLLHAIRRNLSLKAFVHNNQVYGLTKGQASPTSDRGFITKTTPLGAGQPFNPMAVALASDVSFLARGFAGDTDHLAGLIRAAVEHKGFALVDILQPCVSFNHQNTFQWYRQRVYKVEEAGHDPTDKAAAWAKAQEWGDRIPTGIIYKQDRPTFEELLQLGRTSVVKLSLDPRQFEALLDEF
jgi:2-oxoglutarate ferredoxin oxidoreductase subunit beta